MAIAHEEGMNEIIIYEDSELVVERLNGESSQRSLGLHIDLQYAEEIKNSFASIHLHHIY